MKYNLTSLKFKLFNRINIYQKYFRSSAFTNTRLGDIFSNEPIYIFHHIPKCGGSSIRYALGQWFMIISDYKPHNHKNLEYMQNKVNLKKIRSYQCLCSHFEEDGNYLYQRYPEALENHKFKIFTFVRDPLQTKISHYYWETKHGRYSQLSLQEYLFKDDNYIANRFPCDDRTYKNVLEDYFFIGVLEDGQKSINYLADMIGKPRVDLGKENVTKRDIQDKMISNEVAEEFKRRNELDYRIYQYAVGKLNSIK